MDFSTFNTKPAADEGAVLHFVHPVLGHELYDGPGADEHGALVDPSKDHQPVTATVRGYNSDTVQQVAQQGQRRGLERQSKAQQDAAGRDLLDALIVDWQGITRDGKPLPCTKANKVWLTETNHEVFRLIDAFAKDQANFFGKPAKG